MSPDLVAAEDRVPEELLERVLAKLGFSSKPVADRAGLEALYAAWCRGVPFDNTRKLIHLRANDPARLPGDLPTDFLAAWLEYGAGGTCWAVHGALTSVLVACGFDARRGIGTMLAAPNLAPNHGTTSVRLAGHTLLVDGCIQHGKPLALETGSATTVEHPAYGVRARPEPGATWMLRWRSPLAPDGFDCRINSLSGDIDSFRSSHERTRAWGPFNYELFARVHRRGGVVGVLRGERLEFNADGTLTRTPLERESRLRFLIEELGLDEAFSRRVPEDTPTPPPPGSATAARARRDSTQA
jgi:N-hydroxyarylamine O-acetyltransferase